MNSAYEKRGNILEWRDDVFLCGFLVGFPEVFISFDVTINYKLEHVTVVYLHTELFEAFWKTRPAK